MHNDMCTNELNFLQQVNLLINLFSVCDVLGMTWNYIRWWGFSSRALVNVELFPHCHFPQGRQYLLGLLMLNSNNWNYLSVCKQMSHYSLKNQSYLLSICFICANRISWGCKIKPIASLPKGMTTHPTSVLHMTLNHLMVRVHCNYSQGGKFSSLRKQHYSFILKLLLKKSNQVTWWCSRTDIYSM